MNLLWKITKYSAALAVIAVLIPTILAALAAGVVLAIGGFLTMILIALVIVIADA